MHIAWQAGDRRNEIPENGSTQNKYKNSILNISENALH
jgi:hypothetical protein